MDLPRMAVKLSMFDISDSSDVKEIQKYTLENVYSAAVMYDYKAVLIDPEKKCDRICGRWKQR